MIYALGVKRIVDLNFRTTVEIFGSGNYFDNPLHISLCFFN